MQHPVDIRGVADPTRPQLDKLLNAFHVDGKLLAVRHVVHNRPNLGYINGRSSHSHIHSSPKSYKKTEHRCPVN
jgi:hypothetical protein